MGSRYLFVGADVQDSLPINIGVKNPKGLSVSLTAVMQAVIEILRNQLNMKYIG